ncbi:hypothetical protein [Serratia ureilytica]|uniref:hypothetical protein n=1 Tax=Serratia ureilytica TaxID=300181 RepID=UPI0019D23123|nr:hypothetical protein [Serratia ureilytica]MBN5214291.1 hypothetical protein [Serratia ureilytica]
MAKDVKKVKRDLDKWKIKESDHFSKRVTKASKLASEALQKHINRETKGPTNFTKNAVGFQFNVGKFVTRNRIFIKDVQANYLSHLIDNEDLIKKFVPNNSKFVNALGNIPGLKNMRNLVSVDQLHKGQKRTILIKTTAKKNKRLIAIFKKNGVRKKSYGTWEQMSNTMERQVSNAVKASYR